MVQRGKRLRTIIAGYHWFSDWGRDTMISLPGLTLVTKRFKEARQMLHAFAQHVDQGMLPNHFPDGEDKPEYNTVDATLWFFVAIYKYWQYSGDDVFVRHDMMPILQHIIDWHHRGTRYNIRVSEDGLLNAGAPGEQLTWMDARIGDWVVTPRQGKAVEINALWYNALKIYAEMLSHFDRTTEVQSFEKQATWVWKRYNQVFWNPKKKYLNDYVNGDFVDDTLRPNQLFAISLPFSLLSKENAKQVLRAVEAKLLTPLGLRTLSPDHPDYRPKYGGDQFSRDSAYHQGTVWGWLLGAYITALVRVRGATGKRQAQKILHGIETHFREAGIGSISEIFEASPPHAARGCIAQAWSVAEVLRAYMEDL
ncbi:MAG: glycogen debranching protein, partial [candidate division Zixibacteria bacterium]|nr:glycogen debranching protein [candidate division Zixibacteria bacterium]